MHFCYKLFFFNFLLFSGFTFELRLWAFRHKKNKLEQISKSKNKVLFQCQNLFEALLWLNISIRSTGELSCCLADIQIDSD